MVLWISGPTGAGKSTLTRSFEALGYIAVKEHLPEDVFKAFKSDPAANCELLQEEIMSRRFESWKAAKGSSRIVFDRSVDEDVHVFCRMHYKLGLLSNSQYGKLHTLAQELQSRMPSPDLVLFLKPRRKVLTERTRNAGHPPIISENLGLQVSLYSQWIHTRSEDVLTFDNTDCEPRSIERLLLSIRSC